MATEEQQIKLAAKLYAARDAVRTLKGDGYGEYMGRLCAAVGKIAKMRKRSNFQMAVTLAQEAGSGVASLEFLAAAVEMTEGGADGD